MTTPKTIRAYRYHRRGHPADVLKLEEQQPVPKLAAAGSDQVLIRVKAVGLSPVDWKLMKYLPSLIAKHPAIPACDYSGTILESSSSEFKPGDEVYGIIHSTVKVAKGLGSLAEIIVAPASSCVKRPADSIIEAVPAAGISLVALTAIVLANEVNWAIVEKKREDAVRVLVAGGSSSVGLQLVPILKHRGCFVAATCSAAKADLVTGRGADVTFDYKQSNLAEKLNAHVEEQGTFDMVLDCADAFDVWQTSATILRKQGGYVNVGANLTEGILPFARRMVSYYLTPVWLGGVPRSYKRAGEIATPKNVKEMALLVEQGVITPVTDSEYPFEATVAAFERLMSNRATGKVLIRVL